MLLALTASIGACGSDDPTQPPHNNDPTIISLTTFPNAIGPGDSAIVVCNAKDPDGDPLVYDWITDGRLKVKGALPGETRLYNTVSNSQLFYYGLAAMPPDTAWILCYARDDKGGSDYQIANLLIP